MRRFNLVLMFAVCVISALLGANNLLSGIRHYPNSLPLTASLVGLALISFAYALVLLRYATTHNAGQLLILLLYAVSAASGFVACGSLGLLPYTMQSLSLSLVQALDYLWRSVLFCSTLSLASCVLAILYLRCQRAALQPLPGP